MVCHMEQVYEKVFEAFNIVRTNLTRIKCIFTTEKKEHTEVVSTSYLCVLFLLCGKNAFINMQDHCNSFNVWEKELLQSIWVSAESNRMEPIRYDLRRRAVFD